MARPKEPQILALVTDAFGGHGGIALYMRDVLSCLASMSPSQRITLIARVGSKSGVQPPSNIEWRTDALEGKFAFFWSLVRALFRKQNPNLVICGHINLLPFARLAARRTGAPLILFIYGIDAWKAPSSRLARRCVKSTDLVLSISEVTRNRFLAWSGIEPGKVALMPNAIKLENYGVGRPNSELVARYKIRGKRILMTLGRLSSVQRHKGVDEVIAIMPDLLKQFPDLVYLVVGGGDDIPRLRAKADGFGVSAQVIFTGLVDESEKADHYRLADGFALTGFGDGFGFVLLEAMACGIPVAASVLDGSREAIRNGELGVLVDPSDQASLAQGLAEVLKRPKGIPDGLEFFAYPSFCQRLCEAVQPLLGTAT